MKRLTLVGLGLIMLIILATGIWVACTTVPTLPTPTCPPCPDAATPTLPAEDLRATREIVVEMGTMAMTIATPAPAWPDRGWKPAVPGATPGLLGVCQGLSQMGGEAVTWGYVSGARDSNGDGIIGAGEGVEWAQLEPARGEFYFGQLDAWIAGTQPKGVWIQAESENPQGQGVSAVKPGGFVPQWVWNAGVVPWLKCPARCSPAGTCYTSGCSNTGTMASGQDRAYHELWEELIAAMAAHYDNDPRVEAILMMAGGDYGEMGLSICNYTGASPDGWNPDCAYIKQMVKALATWGIVETPKTLATTYTDATGAFWNMKFDYYYVENVKRLIDLYKRHWHNTPVVVQLGSGMSGRQDQTVKRLTAWSVARYGPTVWFKQNGWGNGTVPPGFDYSYDIVFDGLRGKTRTIYEAGLTNRWCGNPAAGCAYSTEAEAAAHNTKTFQNAIGFGVSGACLQAGFWSSPVLYPMPTYSKTWLAGRLLANYNAYLSIPLPGTPTREPTQTPLVVTWTVTPSKAPTETPRATTTPTETPAPTFTATSIPTTTRTPERFTFFLADGRRVIVIIE